ncbi:MAG: metalloregulator ArsR/SmtB family transcription factor [Proteobacteria bacterium]|nr:metalloregulator ArsR/SmtB family transcription factor [Pseudomonadota bacterium]MBU1387998.1 metalloregulator ArsR/SmtB family transcription factor [Pseudomonadota bacterium]MBU1542061.1 metalloregulator ArsR/SmtB family transcription factor [Pseudomonadota bacterium]MBU2430628.1 metalloregulator ArsR/SmtB family transcription factor [Pseudomonadota bacterium]MBU2482845.1 metalloregulator ArsR/SmtB family transcription factor [Pseudomonadota bacterium]
METYLTIIKALADKSRMRVAAALLCYEELCVCQLVELLQLAAPTVSRHMTVLQNARIVQSRKKGRWVYYRLSGKFPEQLEQWFKDALLKTKEIQADQVFLAGVVSCDPEELCRSQKERV